MKDLSFRAPPSLAIDIGDSSPSASAGTIIWSTISNSILIWNGTNWIASGGGGAGLEVSETAPVGVEGMLWFDTTNATINVFFDGNWIESSGPAGRGIVSFTQTAGTGAPGTTDTYTFTYSDSTTSSFDVYNGADGLGGDLKTINGTSLLGTGNIVLYGVPTGGTSTQTLTKTDSTDGNTTWTTLTKSSVGLANVDNTSDADKPVSTATQTALNGKEPTITKATGYAKWTGSAWSFVNETYVQTSAIGVTVQGYSANLAAWSALATTAKQDTLVNTTNIKSVNGTTLLGSGNLSVGTVTSVAASVPSFLSISGSPITGSGTLAITYSGTALPVANGGTGITSYTTNNYIRASGATTLEQRTPAQVLSDIGAAASSHTHVAANITDFDSAARAQVEAMLVAGTNITLTPAGSGATRTITVASTGGGGGGDQITVSATAPSSPTLNQLWLDIS